MTIAFVDSANGFEHKIVDVREAAKQLTTALYLVSVRTIVGKGFIIITYL